MAPAKVNLALHIRGRRSDGYHDIDSLIVFAEIGDRLRVDPSGERVTLELGGPLAGELEGSIIENLAFVAALALADHAGKRNGQAALSLTKNLPVAAGLGGGSADAAAALRLLNQVWELGLSPQRLADIGAAIGADVPMCVQSLPVRATGKGDHLANASGVPPLPMVLVFPAQPVSTAAVFGRFEGIADPPLPTLPKRFGTVSDTAEWLGQTVNGLEAAAEQEAPIIRAALQELSETEGVLLARMSGSGSTCFGICSTFQAAERACQLIAAEHPRWWVKATMTVGSPTSA